MVDFEGTRGRKHCHLWAIIRSRGDGWVSLKGCQIVGQAIALKGSISGRFVERNFDLQMRECGEYS